LKSENNFGWRGEDFLKWANEERPYEAQILREEKDKREELDKKSEKGERSKVAVDQFETTKEHHMLKARIENTC
jgi:hypothetical protein